MGLKNIFGLDESQLWGDQKEQVIEGLDRSPRQLMQSLGDWGRGLDPMLWLTLADRALESMARYEAMGHPGVVITDVRYENEAHFIRERGGVIIHLDRPDANPVHAHSSERGVSGSAYTDICIRNDGTLNDLYCKVADVMDRFSERVADRETRHG